MNVRRPIAAANWKMFKTPRESREYVEQLKINILDIHGVDIILCVPYTSLFHIRSLFKDGQLRLGAQNIHWETQGAFTGEISPRMLKSSGASWVLAGHSERRHLFSETDDVVAKKVKSAVEEGIKPILCVGETLGERERGKTETILTRQLKPVLELLTESELGEMVIAYEPVWAIGTGVNATSDQIEQAHAQVRSVLTSYFPASGTEPRIIYGGSVKPSNADELTRIEGVDGFLVGGASLDTNSFLSIIRSIEENEVKGG